MTQVESQIDKGQHTWISIN